MRRQPASSTVRSDELCQQGSIVGLCGSVLLRKETRVNPNQREAKSLIESARSFEQRRRTIAALRLIKGRRVEPARLTPEQLMAAMAGGVSERDYRMVLRHRREHSKLAAKRPQTKTVRG